DETTGLLKISSDQYDNLESLFFVIGGTTFELAPDGQIWPRSLNSAITGTADGKIYLIVGDIGSTSGSGLDFIVSCMLHYKKEVAESCLSRHLFYSVYDTDNQSVGIDNT
ncbi:hypothetical protein DFH29DRAFT_757835, partial [Suillus ampliporus]